MRNLSLSEDIYDNIRFGCVFYKMFTKYCEADADLRYQNVSINIGGKNVLCDVTGHVKSGEILGVFGGKGKICY